ncbi:hypothetical protein L1887_54466 [Cichorium endivia]|nr:hypothetical protein L1887_54466 [Cichorium endivia]
MPPHGIFSAEVWNVDTTVCASIFRPVLSVPLSHHALYTYLACIDMMTPSRAMTAPGSSGLLRRSLYLPLGLLAVYTTFFIALLTPTLQRHFIFLHAVQFPFFPSFPQPHKYGLAPGKTRALHLDTRDGEKIGVWHVLPEIAYQLLVARDEKMEAGQFDDSLYETAMREYPTVLYLHGNAMHRAAPWRIAAYSALTSRMDVNVVAIDYRGFGDSSGSPSEAGVVEDAHAAYRWIKRQQGRSNQRVTLFGQSLGTGIAAILATQLAEHDEVGVVLMAPYANLRSLVSDFRLGGVLPLLAPVKAIPFHESKSLLPLLVRISMLHGAESGCNRHLGSLHADMARHSRYPTALHLGPAHGTGGAAARTRRSRHPLLALPPLIPCPPRRSQKAGSAVERHAGLRTHPALPTQLHRRRRHRHAHRDALWRTQPAHRRRARPRASRAASPLPPIPLDFRKMAQGYQCALVA